MVFVTLLAMQILLVPALPVNYAGGAVGPPAAIEKDSVEPPAGVVEAPPTYRIGSPKLRGAEGMAAPAPAAANQPTHFVDERGDRGHFFYSDACEDCFYKAPQCGCRPAMEYFACLTKHCHSGNTTRFTDKCGDFGNKCSAELDIDCRGPDTVCNSQYSQLPSGGIGLTLDLSGVDDDAFCGPNGKCTGEIHMKADVHDAVPLPTLPSATVGAQAPAPATGVLAPATATATPLAAPVWLECGLPKVSKPDVDNNQHWILCRAEVVDGTASCDLPMFPTLEASKDKEGYCLLTEGGTGHPPKRLTQPAWHVIGNSHNKNAGKDGVPKEQGSGGFTLPWMQR